MEETAPLTPAEQAAADIDMEALLEEYNMAHKNRESQTTDFPDLDNIVDGIPVRHEAGSTFVGDTTLAGLVRQIPRNSIQQLPVFSARVNGSKESIKAIIASWILRRSVFNEDTFGKGILSTLQIGGEQALTHGYAPFMCATGQMYDDYGTTMRLLHYADVDPESGITDANESGFFYVTANLTKTRVQKILKSARNNPDTSWVVPALEELLEMPPESPNYNLYMSAARQKNGAANNAQTYKFVTRYEVGKQGRFVTFCPQLKDTPLRVINNKSKFGFPRVQFLVIDPAPLTPFGVSRVRLASPNQNLMNAYYQNIINMLLINSDPPILQRGRFSTPVQLKRKAKWVALDQNATADLKQLDNGALAQFPSMAKQVASQIMNIMGGQTTSAPAVDSFSKTAPGTKQAQAFLDSNTEQVTNIMENFLRQYALVALDTHICEQMGEDEVILDDEAAQAINRIAPGTVGDDNKITINWDEFYNGKIDETDPLGERRIDAIDDLGVEIELSLSKNDMEEKQRSDMQDMATTLLQNSDKLSPEMQQKLEEILEALTDESIPASTRWTMRNEGADGAATAMPAGQAPAQPAQPVAPVTPGQ